MAILFLWMVQYRLDRLNAAYRQAGERTPKVQQLERIIKRNCRERFELVYVPEIEEYGLFSANDPRRAA